MFKSAKELLFTKEFQRKSIDKRADERKKTHTKDSYYKGHYNTKEEKNTKDFHTNEIKYC